MTEIAKRFAVCAAGFELGQHGRKQIGKISKRDIGPNPNTESLTSGCSAEVHVVGGFAAPDDTNLGGIRARAAVRAARHVHTNGAIADTCDRHYLVDTFDQLRHDTFRFTQGLPTGRKRRARNCKACKRGGVLRATKTA